MPDFLLVGGPNGAGKSTFIREYLKRKPYRYLCADEAAFELNPEHPESVAAAAGRLFLQRIEEARKEKIDVIVESTLSGKSFLRRAERFVEDGYRVHVAFITPLDPDQSVDRVALRKQKGGHFVPEADIRRRFERAHKNFWESYRFLANAGWTIHHNRTRIGHVEFATGIADTFSVLDQQAFDRFLSFC